jgi:hypothetical protein
MTPLLPLTHPDVTELLPCRCDGSPINTDTLRGWIQRGVIASSGARVRLKATRIGGRWYLRVDDLREFLTATGAPENDFASSGEQVTELAAC